MRTLRYLLFPFSILYWLLASFRNLCFETKVFKSYAIPEKSICVGNLSVGGTGKSPMVAYLLEHFSGKVKTSVLSRGYGRKTKGFLEVTMSAVSLDVGDEPLMYKKTYQDSVGVFVCEDRTAGIHEMRKKRPFDLLLLDDAFQHRKVKAGFSILLSDFSQPFFSDLMLPAGNLREPGRGVHRSDVLVFTKCPQFPDWQTKEKYVRKSSFPAENTFFSVIQYGVLKRFEASQVGNENAFEKILLVTGIANPKPLERFLREKYEVETVYFPDHHQFSVKDMEQISKKFDTFANDKKAIVTTEKDYIRFQQPEFSSFISERPWFYQTMTIEIDREKEFFKKLNEYVGTI